MIISVPLNDVQERRRGAGSHEVAEYKSYDGYKCHLRKEFTATPARGYLASTPGGERPSTEFKGSHPEIDC